jgi:NADH-quinone oxidoreductase subunit K
MPIQYYIFLCLTLFSIGVIGVLTRRNAIIVFMCIELMLNAVNLLLVAFSKMYHGAALQAAPTTTIIVMMFRNTHSVDINFLNRLKN